MRYLALKGEFTRINETDGTLQNASSIYTIEVSDNPTADSGVLLPPLNRISFNDASLFVQCVDGAAAEVRVVPFEFDLKGGGSGISSFILNGEQYSIATNSQILLLLNSTFGEE